MDNDVQSIIKKSKEVRDILKSFENKEKAVEYLVNETKLSKEECSTAYDIIIKIEDQITICLTLLLRGVK